MQFEILKDNRILFVERKGKIKVYDPDKKQTMVIADLPVSIGYYSEDGGELAPTGEDGLHGAILDPDFENNHWIYVFYTPEGGIHRSILSRFEWIGDSLDLGSEIVLLEIPNHRISCCHLGGGLLFDLLGNLYLTTGDNTPNDPRGYTPIDEQEGRSRFDAQRSSGNTNDLRGKILRIHPEPDGTYSIPEGNLFPVGMPDTRPEIYTMGNRNPWRLSMDSKTGWIYWGEVGPAGITDSTGFGPRSYDEFNVAKKPGNFGWPYFLGDNKPYWDFDYSTNTPGEEFDPHNPINNSPNNSGKKNLPEAEPALIWYPQTKSIEFPLMGSGSNSAAGGPIYRQADFDNPSRPFPLYYEGKWFITDWTRGWIMLVSFDNDGNFKSMEQFLPDLEINGPIDMKFGLDGDLYILEYGRGPYKLNPEARLIRIEFNEGNRSPIPAISADRISGAAPLMVNLSSDETRDYDNDRLEFDWTIKLQNQTIHEFKEANPQVNLKKPGTYIVSLKVTDEKNAEAEESIEITVGNDPPQVDFDFGKNNKSFYFFGDTIQYIVEIMDTEDGSLKKEEIQPDSVSVNIEYTKYDEEGLKEIRVSLGELDAKIPFQSVVAAKIINSSDCKSCHSEDEKLIGPSYTQIAEKYNNNKKDKLYLIDKIIKGGSGVWEAKMAMPAHPDINEVQAGNLVDYILDLENRDRTKQYHTTGNYIIKPPDDIIISKSSFGSSNNEKFIFRASYIDNGSEYAPKLFGSKIIVLRAPSVPVTHFDFYNEIEFNHEITISSSSVIPKKSGSFIGLKNIDLTNISKLKLESSVLPESSGSSFGVVEIRVNSPEGELIGKQPLIKGKNSESLSPDNIEIKSKVGFHDIYFVFSNKSNESNVNQTELRSIEFIK